MFRFYYRALRKGKKVFFSLFFWTILSIFILGFILLWYPNPGAKRKERADYNFLIDLSNNYFQSRDDIASGEFIINNEKCKVPDIDIWDPQARNLFKVFPPSACNESAKLTYVNNSVVVINEVELLKLGYELEDISCCYNTIERVSQTLSTYTRDADNLFRYSDECYIMHKITTPKSGFIKVTCKVNTLIPISSKLYEQFHAVALFPDAATKRSGNSLAHKLSFWKHRRNTGNNELPPNILVLAFDSTSRINFHRLMHKTLKVLEQNIEAQELLGYSKVGENTFPNFVPLLTSVSEDELRKICYANRWVPQDDCPYIWKDFSKNKYITAHLEDSPKMSIFNYMKTGFIKPPTDIYLRPLMMAAYQHLGGYPYTVDCIGYQRPEKLILDYAIDLASLASSEKVPYFITTWLTDLTHDDMNGLQNLDNLLAQTLLKLQSRKLLENTMLLLMSDHGYRYLDIRMTKSGWYEDKMPFMFIKLPPQITNLKPEWERGLQKNARQLVTPFDLNYALRDILKLFRVISDDFVEQPKFLKDTPKLRAISPFTKIPMRSCEEAGIPRGYCPCYSPVAYTNKTFIKLAAESFIKYVNDQLPDNCEPLRVSSVIAFGTTDKNFVDPPESSSHNLEPPEISVMAVRTKPGNFLYEVWLKYDKGKRKFAKIFDILRMNQMHGDGSCVSNGEYVDVEKYCYCKYRFPFLF